MSWTLFLDMYSGGKQKEIYSEMYIELPIEMAKTFFINRFGHDPERITCPCCGDDYAINEDESLEKLSNYYRGGISLYEYKDRKNVLIISKKDLEPIIKKQNFGVIGRNVFASIV